MEATDPSAATLSSAAGASLSFPGTVVNLSFAPPLENSSRLFPRGPSAISVQEGLLCTAQADCEFGGHAQGAIERHRLLRIRKQEVWHTE